MLLFKAEWIRLQGLHVNPPFWYIKLNHNLRVNRVHWIFYHFLLWALKFQGIKSKVIVNKKRIQWINIKAFIKISYNIITLENIKHLYVLTWISVLCTVSSQCPFVWSSVPQCRSTCSRGGGAAAAAAAAQGAAGGGRAAACSWDRSTEPGGGGRTPRSRAPPPARCPAHAPSSTWCVCSETRSSPGSLRGGGPRRWCVAPAPTGSGTGGSCAPGPAAAPGWTRCGCVGSFLPWTRRAAPDSAPHPPGCSSHLPGDPASLWVHIFW